MKKNSTQKMFNNKGNSQDKPIKIALKESSIHSFGQFGASSTTFALLLSPQKLT